MGKSILILLLLPFNLFGQLEIQQVRENVFVYTTYQELPTGKFPSNSMYIVTGEGIIMIDTPWDKSQLCPLIDSMWIKHQQRPVLCISTHWHDDRTNGISFLDSVGVATFSSNQTKALCKEFNAETARYTFTKDTLFVVGDVAVKTYYPGPGHSMDNQLISLPQYAYLYGGCFIKSCEAESIGYTKDGDLNLWYENLKKVKKKYKGYDVVITGHEAWYDPKGNFKRSQKLIKQAIRKKN